jgi:hypothetical protein
MAGHREGVAYAEVLAGCLAARENGEAVFPISDSIYFEISKIRSYRQRRTVPQSRSQSSGPGQTLGAPQPTSQTLSKEGWRSMRKVSSDVVSYRQTRVSNYRPGNQLGNLSNGLRGSGCGARAQPRQGVVADARRYLAKCDRIEFVG